VSTEPRTSPRRQVARLTPAAGILIVAALVVGSLAIDVFVAAHRPLSWFAVAIAIAVFLDPIVDRLATRIRRGPAVLLCFLVGGALVLGTAYVVFDDLDDAMSRLQEAAPEAADQIEGRNDRVGQLSRDLHLGQRIDDAVEALEGRIGSGGDVLKSTALTAPAYLIVAILTVFLLSYGPKIGDAALAQLPKRRRRGVNRVLVRAARRARAATLLPLAVALVFGALVSVAAAVVGVPAPAALGVLATLFAVLPHLGIVLGAVPLLLLTLGLDSGITAAAVGIGAVALQAVDSAVVRPRVELSVHIGLLVPWVVVLLAYDVYGVGAAAFGLGYAIFGMALLDELALDDVPSDGDTPGALAASSA
jgi:predicted PurR-regulated permease PerM